MRIDEIRLASTSGWPALKWSSVRSGLNVVYGAPGSGKSTIGELLGHVLYGQPPALPNDEQLPHSPEGEVVVQCDARQYRLRRYHAGPAGVRLTVTALDGSPVVWSTVREFVGGLTPAVLGPLCAVNFRTPPNLARLLSGEFAAGFRSLSGVAAEPGPHVAAKLSQRRDELAEELESRIAGERRASQELDARWRELDRRVRDEQQQVIGRQDQLHSVEAALAETDARLRYRRLELNTDVSWLADAGVQPSQQAGDLDHQIVHWRATLAELAEREASVRARLVKLQQESAAPDCVLADQRAWLNVMRQLSADLSGEVARLARASASQTCVCRDAHPRLRPISETFQRQLESLASLIGQHDRATQIAELQYEVDHLGRTAAELQNHVDQLAYRREQLGRTGRARRLPSHGAAPTPTSAANGDVHAADASDVDAADIHQLEQRRLQLEQERFQLVETLRLQSHTLRELKSQRDTVAQQRAALLTTRSMESLQRELADVQLKLRQASASRADSAELAAGADHPVRASDYLAQMTDGRLVRLVLVDNGRAAQVVNAAGHVFPVDALSAAERDVAYLSLCLALHSAAANRGVWLPLILDEPFVRLDGRDLVSVVAVLNEFCRQGHQAIVFTAQQAAAQRLSSLGATVREITTLRHREDFEPADSPLPNRPPASAATQAESTVVSKPRRAGSARRRKTLPQQRATNGKSREDDHSDAA